MSALLDVRVADAQLMNLVCFDVFELGNHEFDKGVPELKRMQDGGCIQHTRRMPCAAPGEVRFTVLLLRRTAAPCRGAHAVRPPRP